jgi:hypothetical protein
MANCHKKPLSPTIARVIDRETNPVLTTARTLLILAVIWLMAWWMWRQKIFVRI